MKNAEHGLSVSKMAETLKKPSAKIFTMITVFAGLAGAVLTTDVEAAKKKKKTPKITPPAGMVYVPEGCFKMGTANSQPGDDDEKPQHEHCLKGFFIDKYELTVAKYKELVDAGKVLVPISAASGTALANYPDKPEHPMNNIDWGGMKAACEAQGKRLPTEAEWEEAARGPDGRKYPWGNNDPTPGVEANFGKPYQTETVETDPVGSHPQGASPYGAEDMAGNVKEFVADLWGPKYTYRAYA